jgi:hypothetical protein
LKPGLQQFTLTPGCQAQFQDHHLFSDLSIKMPSKTKPSFWDWEEMKIFKQTPSISSDLVKLQTFGLDRIALSTLNLQRAATTAAWTVSLENGLLIGVGISIVTLVLFGITCCTLLFVRKQKAKQALLTLEKFDYTHDVLVQPSDKMKKRKKQKEKKALKKQKARDERISYHSAGLADSQELDFTLASPSPDPPQFPDGTTLSERLPVDFKDELETYELQQLPHPQATYATDVYPAGKLQKMTRHRRRQSDVSQMMPTTTSFQQLHEAYRPNMPPQQHQQRQQQEHASEEQRPLPHVPQPGNFRGPLPPIPGSSQESLEHDDINWIQHEKEKW